MKNVCVIGAGVAGLACTKELTEAGINVDCYEMMPIIGGVFGTYGWRGGQLTSSTVFTWFSDFPILERQRFLSWEEFLNYLENYVDHFQFRESIHLNCKVINAKWDSNKWMIQVHKNNWSNGHYLHPQDNVKEQMFNDEYSHLIICSGLHNVPFIPAIDNLETFTGNVLHSSEYRDAKDFAGQKVTVVGAGESASDIAQQIAQVAEKTVISTRSPAGTLFPRFIQGNTPDIRDDRLTYNLPRNWSSLILRGHKNFYYKQREMQELFHWAADYNFRNNRCSFNSNACKSFGIPTAVIEHNAVLKNEITYINKNKIIFSDSTEFISDSLIFCTGYKMQISFLDPDISKQINPINQLWKNILHPDWNNHLFFAGFSRPQQINLISIAEMQARTITLIISGKKQIPDKDQSKKAIDKDQIWMKRYYQERYTKNPALVDYLYYMEGLAKFIGCEVPLRKVFLKDPYLWWKIIFTSLNGAHYRLVGPGKNWEQASATIKSTPIFANYKSAIFRWTILSILTMYSWIISLRNNEYRSVSKQAKD